MQKKIIPILIALMVVSLIGVIYIQYRWIQNTIAEKQKLIDVQVYRGIANVEERLNDQKALKFVKDSLISKMAFSNDTASFFDVKTSDSNKTVEVKVMSMFNTDIEDIEMGDQVMIHHGFSGNSHFFRSDSIKYIERGDVNQIVKILEKISFENVHENHDVRLDSSMIHSLLIEELSRKLHGTAINWGVYDGNRHEFVITPSNTVSIDYKVPLFSTDVLYPGRYELRLDLDKNDLIWQEIKVSTVFSILFLLVIISVFAFSIRLIIKHKNISQIKSDFINNMTHEFKTPLASISLAADSLVHPNAVLTDSYLKEYVDIIQQEKDKLNSHVERILEVAALNRDALEITVETVNLLDIITNAIKNLSLLIEKNRVKIQFAPTSEIMVLANQTHLENIIVNLIENGIKYGGELPVIKVEVNENKDFALIKITDNGIGMTKRQLNKVFDHFYRAQTGDLHNSKGFGLGLSYCKLVIEKMGGSISLDSQINKGTVVELKVKKQENKRS